MVIKTVKWLSFLMQKGGEIVESNGSKELL